jgi:hypothetical protein
MPTADRSLAQQPGETPIYTHSRCPAFDMAGNPLPYYAGVTNTGGVRPCARPKHRSSEAVRQSEAYFGPREQVGIAVCVYSTSGDGQITSDRNYCQLSAGALHARPGAPESLA